MNIQRSVLEGKAAPVSRLGGEGVPSLASLLAEVGLSPSPRAAASSAGGRPPRIPEGDIVVIGRERGVARAAPEAPGPGEDARSTGAGDPASRRARLRTTVLLLLAAYYMAWGLYEGVQSQKARPIYVNPTLNGRTVIT